jgi:PEP-CTERM motif
MLLSSRRRTAVKRGAFAVAIAIVFVALIAAPQVFHTSTPPSAPASEIADVAETSPDAGADVAVTLPRPSGLSTAAVARAGHSLDVLASVHEPDVDLSEMPDLDLWLAQIPGTSDQHLFSGVDGLFAGYDSYVDQPIDVPEMQLARYFPIGSSAGGFGGGSRRGSAASGNAGGGGGSAPNAQGNSSQLNPSSPGGNIGNGGNGNNNGGNGNNNTNGGNGNNTNQPNGTNPHGDEHSQGEIHSSSGDNQSVGLGGGPAGPSSIGSSEEPISVPEPSTLLLAGFGLSGLMASRRLTHRAR